MYYKFVLTNNYKIMKKIFLSIVLVISLLSPLFTSANKDSYLEKKLYKNTIISQLKISKDYWKKYNEKISKIFIKFRYEKDTETLNKLKDILKSKISEMLQRKNSLNYAERKKLNLYQNLYYRTILLIDYQL